MTPSGKIIRLLLLILILAGVLPFFLPWNKPLLSWRSLSLPDMPDVPKALDKMPQMSKMLAEGKEEKADKPQPVTVYRWRDEQGNWHFSDDAPQKGVKFEQMKVDPNTNIVPATKVAPEQPAPEQQEAKNTQKDTGYTAEELSKLKEKAEAAKKALEQHYKDQQQRLQELR